MLCSDHARALPTSQPAAPAKKARPSPSAGQSEQSGDPTLRNGGARRGKRKRGKNVISLDDDFLVEGKLEKPSAFYVLRRSTTNYDWARLEAYFTPLVLDAVQDPLF
ncbi:MAG: hypothetical protein V3V08_19540 [Nannocystaceae bacterium]